MNIRNLNPIQGGSWPVGPDIYFLSNKNFAVLSDSIFVVHISGTLDDPQASLTVDLLHMEPSYGAPPYARQAGTHSFDTNDSRVLGGFIENGMIQFVGNTIDTNTGFAAFYHGTITELDSDMQISGAIIGDTAKDFGYPNISYTGNDTCDREAIITFDHSSPNDFAGMSAIYYTNTGEYSEIVTLKEGDSYVNQILGGYERWGDYSGTQRMYNEPGTIWSSGFWGDAARKGRTWVAELTSPDETIMAIDLTDSLAATEYEVCDGEATVSILGGIEPFSILWSDSLGQKTATASLLCAGDHRVWVTDASGCIHTRAVKIGQPDPPPPELLSLDVKVYPNPASDWLTLNFMLDSDQEIDVLLYDVNGKEVDLVYSDNAKQGRNLFSLSTSTLAAGVYVIKIRSGKTTLLAEKFLKHFQ